MRLEWPNFVQEYYESQDKVSDSEIALNLDCLLDRSHMAPIYANLISVSILPILLTLLIILMWRGIAMFLRGVLRHKFTSHNHTHYTKGTVINMLFMIHPLILKTTMEIFSCTTIEGNKYLDTYMEDECWTGDHAKYAISVALPAFLLWGLGLPLFAFFRLKNLYALHKLDTKYYQEVYGFLYLGYIKPKYWWQLVVLFRKFMVLVALIWLS